VVERPVTRLEDLPAFRILQVTNADDPELIGVFTHLKSVRAGRSWLYAGDADSLIGDLVDLDEASRQARCWRSRSSAIPLVDLLAICR
jgi:hypothetical protein